MICVARVAEEAYEATLTVNVIRAFEAFANKAKPVFQGN